MGNGGYTGGGTVITPDPKSAGCRRSSNKKLTDLQPLYLELGQWCMTIREFRKVYDRYRRKYPNGEVPFEKYWRRR